MCKEIKYRILARRNENEDWTDWNSTDDPNKIRKMLNHVEECGYEASVEDTKLKFWERKFDNGYLLFNPVKPGDFRCIVFDKGKDSYKQRYVVESIIYDGEKWYAKPRGEDVKYEVDSMFCLTLQAATKLLKKLKGDEEDDV